MRISDAEIARYRAGLDKLASEAGSYVADLHAAMAESYPDASVAEVREAMKDAVDHALNAFGDQASTLACDLFDEIMEAEGVKARSRLYDAIDRDLVDGKLRYLARDLVGGNLPEFARSVTDLTEFYVKRSAYENMVRNCDDNNVRYARVPSGRETCSFCFMLCSRGFVYHSEATAKGKHGMHPHCDCVVIPGVRGKTSIEGYDPDAMSERWGRCLDALGGEAGVKHDWEALPDDARSAYEEKHGGNALKAYERNRILREVETRDWRWLYSGIVPKPVYEKPRDALEDHEKLGVDWLSNNGIRPTVKQEDPKAPANIDFEIDGRPWEMKNVSNAGSSVKNQLARARKKWWKLGLEKPVRVVVTMVNCADDIDSVVNAIIKDGGYGEVVVTNGEKLVRKRK